jgi:predicted RNA-binding protein with RPS1 domain
MGQCIICGKAVDGKICDSHEEDVVFEFEGTKPEQLARDRFYHGTVDGYADFGVFVNLGQHVTGLLHRSKLDRRLESLDWDVGDTVFVQVTNVRDNGDVDLGWSIRQAEREFRGVLVDDPERGEYEPEAVGEAAEETEEAAEAVEKAEEAIEEAAEAAGDEEVVEEVEEAAERTGAAEASRKPRKPSRRPPRTSWKPPSRRRPSGSTPTNSRRGSATACASRARS